MGLLPLQEQVWACEPGASRDNSDHRWLAVDPKGLPNTGSCVKLRPLLPVGVLSVCGNALSILLSCTTSGIHLVLWPGDQRSWIDSKGMTVCQVKSWTVSVQAQASGRWRAGWQRGACGQGLCSHLSWQPLRAALPSLCCQTSSLASELFLLQDYFYFGSSSLVPTPSKKLRSRVRLSVILLAADLLTWKTCGAECLPWGCWFRWDYFRALPFMPSVRNSFLLKQSLTHCKVHAECWLRSIQDKSKSKAHRHDNVVSRTV